MNPTPFWIEDTEGNKVLNGAGRPFAYSTRDLANIGRRILAKELSKQLLVKGP